MTLTVGGETIVLMDKKECAELLGVTARTVWEYVHSGRLPAQLIGGRWWVTEENLISFMRGETADPAAGKRLRQKETRKRSGLKQNQNRDEPDLDFVNEDSILW